MTTTSGGVVGSEANATIAQGGTNATSAAAGTIPNATNGSASSWTATPTLGASGTLGSLTFGNATSGLLTLQTATGAITSYTLDLPVAHPAGSNTFLSCTAANPAVCTWAAGGSGSGLSSMTALGFPIPDSATTINASTTPGTNQGTYLPVRQNGTQGVASTITESQVGIGGRSITGSTASDTVLYSDVNQVIDHDQGCSAANTETLDTPANLHNTSFGTIYWNQCNQTDTLKATTNTIQVGTSAPVAGSTGIAVGPGVAASIKQDPNLSTNWLVHLTANGSGAGGDTITSPNSTLSVGGTSSATTLDLVGAAGEIMAGATPALTYTPTLGKSGTAGTLSLFPSSGNFTTTLASAATASNTVNFFASVPTNLHSFYCATASTTCTLTDTGYAYNAIPIANIGTAGLSGTSPVAISAAGAISLSGAAGQIPNGASGAFTATPTLGAAGTLGSLTFGNATSGLLTLQTATGAITSYTIDLPVAQPSGGNTFLSCTAANPAVCTWAAPAAGGDTITSPNSTLSIGGTPAPQHWTWRARQARSWQEQRRR